MPTLEREAERLVVRFFACEMQKRLDALLRAVDGGVVALTPDELNTSPVS